MMKTAVLTTWDIVAIVLYFLLIVSAGLFAMCKAKRGTVTGYFLAGRNMPWFLIGASLFTSNIGSDHFIGLAGSGAAAGVGVGAFEVGASMILQFLGFVLLPVFIASKVSTLPEYMSKRFGGQRISTFLSVLSLLLYIFTKISVNLYSGALFIRHSVGWDLYLSILLLLAITAIFTITGGLSAVLYMDSVQCIVMVLGAGYLTIRTFLEIGGFEQLMVKYMEAIPNKTIANTTCGYPRADSWVMLRDPVNSDIPWPGYVFGMLFPGIWYWCTDQMMVQRTLSAKSLSHAQGGTIFTGFLKVLPMFFIVLPGMISRVLYTDIVACSDPDECFEYCSSRTSCSNLAYPMLVLHLLPEGLRGIMVAVMMAALMSDLTSVFNSASTLFTMDIWQLIRKKAQTRELLIVGKVFVMFMVGVSIAWIPISLHMQGGQLFLYIQAISSYLAPPIAVSYLMAVFWKRFNEQGAFWSLMVGFCTGVIRMVLDFYYLEPDCGQPDTRPSIVAKVHYMYFSLILAVVTFLSGVGFSLMTKPPEEYRLIRTLYWTRKDGTIRPDEQFNINKMQLGDAKETQSSSSVDTYGSGVGDHNGLMKTKAAITDPSNVSFGLRIFHFFCGNTNEDSAHNNAVMNDHIQKISSLKQNPRAKKFLLCCIVGIVIVEVTVFIFFTFGTPYMLNSLQAQHQEAPRA